MSATDAPAPGDAPGDTATRRRGDAATKSPAPGPRPPAPKLAMLIASFLGAGYSPFAPGTAGSAAALAIAILLGWNPLWFAVLAAAALAPAIWAAGRAEVHKGVEDPSLVVVDEAVGQWIAIAGATTLNWKSFLAAFVLFRLFDIFKPPPVRQLERLHGGVGIVMDDVMAGVYAALVLFLAGCFNLY